VRERRRASDRQPEVARDVANSIEPTQTAGRGDVVSTELGGIFYLLDLALHLGLYGDFTEPERPGLELDPWDLLCLLAAALGAARGAADDPVWPLLARLAGRDPRSRPGASFVTPAGWQIPVDWVRPFASTPVAARSWRWSAARSRLLIDHPAGFPVVDIPVDGDVTRRMVRASIHRYGPGIQLRRGRAIVVPLRHTGRRPVDLWIARVAAYARVRLALALALDEPGQLVDVLLRRPARIFVSGARVEVVFSLADLPIAVRIAGLDRDPGWIPAAGRDVRFRFE
jgi:hypothetical protein